MIFHILAGYDSHLSIKNLASTLGQLTCIPNTEGNYISFSKKIQVSDYKSKDGKIKPLYQTLRFLDSFKFMGTSLQNWVDKTSPDAFRAIKKVFGNGALDPELYRVTPAESENDRKITLREVIDRRKLEFIVSHPDHFELGSRLIKGK